MLTALWVRPPGQKYGGQFVRELRREDSSIVLPLSLFEARRLAAELNARADMFNPRPKLPPGQGGGTLPFGWRFVPRGLSEPDIGEWETIDLIVSHVLDGYTRSESVAALNALGHRTRAGREWTRDSLRQVQNRLARDGVLVEPRTVPAS